MGLVWIAMYAPAALSILAIGLWVAVDQAAEARRRASEGRHAPVVIDGRLVTGQVAAVGIAPVPPRSYRRRTSASYRSDAAVAYRGMRRRGGGGRDESL